MVFDHARKYFGPKKWAASLRTVTFICVSGCASVTPPDGGERDTVAPKLISSTPVNEAVRVEGRQITLLFDEPVTADQLLNQLTITPATDIGTPKITERDNSISLIFPKPFAANTTYLVDFGQSVADITERNKAQNLQLIFSTGAYLDSGQVKGVVQDLLTGKKLANALVGLYVAEENQPIGDTSLSRLNYRYHTRTDASGIFHLRNIKPNRYRIFAFADANKNAHYDEPELVAYQPTVLRVGTSDTLITLSAARLDTKPPVIANRQEQEGALSVQYTEGVQRVRILNSLGKPAPEYSLRRNPDNARQLTVFGAPSAQARRIFLTARDSAGNQRLDSLNIRFGGSAKTGAGGSVKPSVELSPAGTTSDWRVTFPARLKINKQQIGRIVEDTATVGPVTGGLPTKSPKKQPGTTERLMMGDNATLDSSATILTIRQPKRSNAPSRAWMLVLDSTAIGLVDLPGQGVTGRPLRLEVAKGDQEVGSITINPQPSVNSYALELLRENNSVVSRSEHWRNTDSKANRAVQPITWAGLPPGKYRVRVLVDANGNGRWDGPDRTFTRLPEPVLFGLNELVVRANWEQEATVAF